MNMKTKQQLRKVMIVAFVKQKRQPQAFHEWPLHVTIIPPWIDLTDVQVQKTEDFMQELTDSYLPIRIRGDKPDAFGARKDIPVMRVFSKRLEKIHRELLDFFRDMPVTEHHFNHSWVGDEYKPHVTEQSDALLELHEETTIDSLSLIERIKPSEPSDINKRVIFHATT